jgi:predicted DNA-binding mobile mystery protein A
MDIRFKQLKLRQLDATLRPWRTRTMSRVPEGGWIKAIRTAVGMTSQQLALRLGVTQPALAQLEMREAKQAVTLEALARTANALECDVVYALVPRQPLADMVAAQARRVATARLRRSAHTMALEAQSVSTLEQARQVDELTQRLLAEWPRTLWELRPETGPQT